MAQKPPDKQPDRAGITVNVWKLPDAEPANDQVKAWKIHIPEVRPEHAAGLDSWLVYHPGSHPFWDYYGVSLIHLRDTPGAPPANKQFPEATHEILFVSLSPEAALPDVDDWQKPAWMTPPDVCAQFEVNNDDEARNVLNAVLDAIVEHGYALDSDHRTWWKTSIQATAMHERTGEHR